jgi:transposase-like protein
MNAISPIQVIKTTGRTARCGKPGESTRSSASEVRQLQAELAHLRYELQTLKQATQQFVRQML